MDRDLRCHDHPNLILVGAGALVEADDVWGTDFNLSANRHRPVRRAVVEHREPLEVSDELEDAVRGT